ncbi:glycosyltransferase [Engelhardtia mirabilis]|uniref:Glycosyl transferases group 1 n=1 Tax=Engelhardtia mirabilis TaxID=2528011 RepID=A0A518BR22_9BACT|nr:Glycosyl transferases group 1 [Planctomycetes bacterium Pla133]QDV03750.1 Glycosyl transferases group 1 [Planctomycetes bacterium Pla86]
MHVALDYLPATTHAPGVGRYLRELVRAVAQLDERPNLTLFEVGGEARTIGEPHLGLAGIERIRRIDRRLPRRLVGLAGRVGLGADRICGAPDLFQRALPGTPPVSRSPVVRGVAEMPLPGSPDEAAFRATLDAERAWLTFSTAATEALVERFDRRAESVFQVTVGAEHWARALPEPPPRDDPPTLVVLGAVRTDRFPDLVVDAFDRLCEELGHARLVFCGRFGDAAQHLGRRLAFSSGRSRIRWIDQPVEADLPGLVARASALVHLATNELTPVTPLEALAVGTPVVVSDLPALREALGEEAWYVPTPPSLRHRKALPGQLAEAVASASDPAACERRRALAGRFTWNRCARSTVQAWRAIAAD